MYNVESTGHPHSAFFCFCFCFFLQRSSNSLCYGFSKWLHNAVLVWYSYIARVASSTFQQKRVFRAGQSVCLPCRRSVFNPWVGKILWRRKWQSIPVLLPGKSHGQRSLVGYSLWGRKESDMTEWLHFTLVYRKKLIAFLPVLHIHCLKIRMGGFLRALSNILKERR